MILNCFFMALGQVGDPRFRRVLFLGVGLAIALLILVFAVLMYFLNALFGAEAVIPFVGEVRWINDFLNWTSIIALVLLSVILMVPVASVITSLFLDDVAHAVEEKHYPNLPPVGRVPLKDGVMDTLGFLGLLVGANLLAIILYFMFPPFALFIFWGVNGFLLGREYYTLAAIRRVGRDKAIILRRRHVWKIWTAGILMAMPLSFPLINLIIPILGAATFTHLFHQLEARAPSG